MGEMARDEKSDPSGLQPGVRTEAERPIQSLNGTFWQNMFIVNPEEYHMRIDLNIYYNKKKKPCRNRVCTQLNCMMVAEFTVFSEILAVF